MNIAVRSDLVTWGPFSSNQNKILGKMTKSDYFMVSVVVDNTIEGYDGDLLELAF